MLSKLTYLRLIRVIHWHAYLLSFVRVLLNISPLFYRQVPSSCVLCLLFLISVNYQRHDNCRLMLYWSGYIDRTFVMFGRRHSLKSCLLIETLTRQDRLLRSYMFFWLLWGENINVFEIPLYILKTMLHDVKLREACNLEKLLVSLQVIKIQGLRSVCSVKVRISL